MSRTNTVKSVDLLWKIISRPVQGGWVLHHELSSPSGILGIQSILGESEVTSESQWINKSQRIFKRLEDLLHKKNGQEPLFDQEVWEESTALGEDLWRRLVPRNVRQCILEHGNTVTSLLIETSENWIPWELIIPDSTKEIPFLGCRYSMTRWYPQNRSPKLNFSISRVLGITPISVEGHTALPFVNSEKMQIDNWIQNTPELSGILLARPTRGEVLDLLQQDNFDLLHFAGHARYDPDDSDNSQLILTDTPLRPIHLTSRVLNKLGSTRPLIFLNACSVGYEGPRLSGLGGWPERFVQQADCGALICPSWGIHDRIAGLFSEIFYSKLGEGLTLGRAMLETRLEILLDDQSPDLSTLAYVAYGHPNALVHFGNPSDANISNFCSADLNPSQSPPHRPSKQNKPARTAHATGSKSINENSISPEEPTADDIKKMTKLKNMTAPFAFGLTFITMMFLAAFMTPEPTDFQYTFFRIILALSAAGIVASISDFFAFKVGGMLQGGGALVVFLVVYLLNPAVLVVPKLSVEMIHLKSTQPDAEGWAVDTDPIQVDWLAQGPRQDIHVLLENPRSAKRTESLRVSSNEGKVVFEPEDYRQILTNRDYQRTNRVRAVIRSEDDVFVSKEFDLHVGITLFLFGTAPDDIHASAIIDDSTEAIPIFEYSADVVGWNSTKTEPFVVEVSIQNPLTQVSFEGIEEIDWESLAVSYRGPLDHRRIRTWIAVNLPTE